MAYASYLGTKMALKSYFDGEALPSSVIRIDDENGRND